MEEKPMHVKFWEELAQESERKFGRNRYLNKLKKRFLEADFKGEEVLSINEGPLYRKALEMVFADIEFLRCEEKLKHADERRRLKAKAFWIDILEETGLDEESGLTFDPLHLKILCNRSSKEKQSNSLQLSLDGYKDLVMAALVNPLNATRMVSDPFLNFWEIKKMAQAVTDGDFNGINYDKEDVSWFTRLESRISLPGGIDWQTSGMYMGPSESATSKIKGMYNVNLAFSKDILKEKGTLALNVSDLFNSRKRNSTNYSRETIAVNEFQWRQRQIMLNFTYRFNQNKKNERSQREDNGGEERMF